MLSKMNEYLMDLINCIELHLHSNAAFCNKLTMISKHIYFVVPFLVGHKQLRTFKGSYRVKENERYSIYNIY